MTKCAFCNTPLYGDAFVDTERNAIVHKGCQKAYDAKIHGRTHPCPQCLMAQEIEDRSKPIRERVLDEESTAQMGYFAQAVYRETIVGYEKKTCPLCDGWGWLANKPEPIKEEKIIGWRKT